jgi:hypothetical protein
MIGQGHGHMSDRLALANAIQDAGIERDKAERLATVIFNAIHDNVATKADVQGAEARLNAQVAGVRADLALGEHRLMTRLGGLMGVFAVLLFAALHYWPPHP